MVVDYGVAADCGVKSTSKVAKQFQLSLPDKLVFVVGSNWQATPISVRIGNDVYAANGAVLSVVTQELSLSSGIVDRRTQLRMVVADSTLCARAPIELRYQLQDRKQETVRLILTPAAVTGPLVSPSTDARLDQYILSAFGDGLRYVFSQEQAWATDFVRSSVSSESERNLFVAKFCNKCTWRSSQRLATALATFIDEYPHVLQFPSMSSGVVALQAVPLPKTTCGSRTAQFNKLGGFTYYQDLAPNSENDLVIRLVVADSTKTDSYVELRARRSQPYPVVGVETVVIRGASIGERCDY